jgi:hypothetical protein
MAAVQCQVVRWVADEPQPGLVEAQLTDSDGRLWRFIDKEPIFWPRVAVTRLSQFPVAGAIRCQIIGHEVLADGREVVTVDTGRPDGVDSEGVTIFRVSPSAMAWTPARNAVELEDLPRLRDLLNAGHDVEDDDGNEWTLLRHALDVEYDGHVQSGGPLHADVTAFLLARGADPLRECNGIPVVVAAERMGHWLAAEIMRAWIRAEAHLNSTGSRSSATTAAPASPAGSSGAPGALK